MRRGETGWLACLLVPFLGVVACGPGGGGTADDLPIAFGDLAPADPGTGSDPGTAGDDRRDPGAEAQGDLPLPDVGDPGSFDPGEEAGELPDPGIPDTPPVDPGTPDPGTGDPGGDAEGCGTGPACGAGTVCIDGTCDTCRFHFACGPECVSCVGTATPLCLEGTCVRCRVTSDCGAGFWCRTDTHACEPCGDADPLHCGPDCAACPADRPSCQGGECRCTADSCGDLSCVGGECRACTTDDACGPDCTTCTGTATPFCLSGACVGCRSDLDCTNGSWCRPDTHACEPCGAADPLHCGPACTACPADRPSCEGGDCRCTPTSCGGLYCIDGDCRGCDTDDACGPACSPCPAGTPHCASGLCVECRGPLDCAAGNWCDGGTCRPCSPDDPQHCGASCTACGGTTPGCRDGACVCQEGSCGTGMRCVSGGCQACDVPEACGPACVPCGTGAPFCVSGACRECRTMADCPSTSVCSPAGACVDCTGTLGCADDRTPSAKTCATAKVLGRTPTAAGVVVTGNTTDQGNDDNLPSLFGPDCWDGQVDQMYRVYVRAGDRLDVTATPLETDYQMSLKLYRGTACDEQWETDLVACQWKGGDAKPQAASYTATEAGWITIVVDGASAFTEEADWGAYRLDAKLACTDAACCCR